MIKMLHSFGAWAILLAIVIALVNAIIGMTSNKSFEKKDKTLTLAGFIAAHIQLLFGLGVYFVSAGYQAMKVDGFKSIMKDSLYRDQVMEHPLAMIIAIILITMGYAKHKNKTIAKAKFKTIAIYYGIALLIILAKIPWGQWI